MHTPTQDRHSFGVLLPSIVGRGDTAPPIVRSYDAVPEDNVLFCGTTNRMREYLIQQC